MYLSYLPKNGMSTYNEQRDNPLPRSVMFDKFTNRAKQVIKLAKKEAQRLNHNYLGTEHLLLGLLKLGQGIAVNVLRNMNLNYDNVRAEIEKIVGMGPETQVYSDPALTGKVKKVF